MEDCDEGDEGFERDRNGSRDADRSVEGLIAEWNGLRERGKS